MKKYIADFIIKENSRLNGNCSLLKLVPSDQTATLPEILPGQFIQVKIDNSTTTFLRRPISVNFVENNELWIAVQAVGEGTRRLTELQKDDRLNLIFPLGNAFTL
ncbi:MAG: dihydroorotate dehydrogenase electron transfer subunit, partial [Dysgonamonadaceae bacterium]|nr:dihydroorotate dehydrogenase electron transfer subunit [Dysgonamonadaceae bacterium]